MMKTTPALVKLFHAFDMAGFEVRIVGGAVRDYLLGEEPKDIDLCTDALPSEMTDIATNNKFKIIPTGIDHGTMTIVVDDELFEVTTLRIDVDTNGRHAEVSFTRDFEEDARRRDLTINAMSMDLKGNVYDYFGGREDLENARIRFVGNASERVREDYLRILRYFRFAARFNAKFDICELTRVTEEDNLRGLQKISVERYWLEMQKLVVMPGADTVLRSMFYTGVLNAISLGEPRFNVAGLDSVTALSSMLTPETLPAFLARWKLSSDESKKLAYVLNNQDVYFEEDVEMRLMAGVARDWVAAAAQVSNTDDPESELYKYAMTWDVPTFPVTGQDLLDLGMVPGPQFGKTLAAMRQKWMESVSYERDPMTKDQLMKEFDYV